MIAGISYIQKPAGGILKICLVILGLIFMSVDLIPDYYGESFEVVSSCEHDQGSDEKEIEKEDTKEHFQDKLDYSAKYIDSAMENRFFNGHFYYYSISDIITPPPEHLEIYSC